MDEALVKARVAGRKAANELAELYVTESARLKTEHGLEAAMAFLDTLRDNLIEIRPLPKVEPVKEIMEPPAGFTGRHDAARSWDERTLPDRFVLVGFDDECKSETDKAVLIGETWIPKSQLYEIPEVGEYVDEWPVTEWFADKEGLEY